MSQDGTGQGEQGARLTAFQSFVLSLGSSSMVHLGEIPDPETRAPRPNLRLAQATIETLEMLSEKTNGNLAPQEEKTLQRLLTELRMRFVAAANKQ